MDTDAALAPARSAVIDGAAADESSGWPPVFLGATAVVGLHLVDDNYVQPAAGTAALDHVASGLVPLALLALGCWFYLRVRAGARALIAIAVGVFGVMVGALEAGYYSVAVGPSGDDYTGLLAIPAGLVLVGVGVSVLWRSRRPTSRLWWRYGRRLLLGLVGVVALYEIVVPVAVAYMATHVARAVVADTDLGAPYENVTLKTSDGLSLEGWYVPSKNGAAVISFPGRKASGTQAQTRMLVKHGYGVLLFDRRGEGASQGDGNMFGWGGERDIFAALDFLEQRPDVDPARIGGIGLSVGGELMLQAAAQDQRLAAVVSEGSGTRSLPEELDEYDGVELVLNFPLLVAKTAAVAVFSNTVVPPKLTDLIPQIAPRPTMFIWAPNGGNVEWMNPTYSRLAGANSSIWEIDDVSHIHGLAGHPEEYEKRVVGFFDAALLQAQP